MADFPYLTDEEYRFVYGRAPRLCLDLAVVEPDGLILSKRDIPPFQGFWHFPGGRIYHNETAAEAAARIADAELGITVDLDAFAGYIEVPNETEFVHSVSLVFFAKRTGGEIRGSKQAKDVRKWRNLPEDNMPPQQDFLKRHWEEVIKRCNSAKQ